MHKLIIPCYTVLLQRDRSSDEKAKPKKKVKEKKTTKLKTKEGEDDGGEWTEVKGSSLTAAVSNKKIEELGA